MEHVFRVQHPNVVIAFAAIYGMKHVHGFSPQLHARLVRWMGLFLRDSVTFFRFAFAAGNLIGREHLTIVHHYIDSVDSTKLRRVPSFRSGQQSEAQTKTRACGVSGHGDEEGITDVDIRPV